MSVIKIIQDVNERQVFCYRVCGHKIITNSELRSLAAFDDKNNCDELLDEVIPTLSEGEIIFEGISWLAEKNRQIICSKFDQGYLIDVPEISEYFVTTDGSKIIQMPISESNSSITHLQLEYTMLGPPLMLTLALNQYFALHASSIEISGQAVLFVGESGFGKSTMAKYLQNQSGLKRLSDDISVISNSDSIFILNSDFPQLKLKDESQNSSNDNRGLGAIIILNRQNKDAEINLTKLNSINAIEVLLNHGVAAQLFAKALANQHLKFVADLASQIPIYRLNYPNGLDHINTIAKILKDEFD